MTQCTVRSRCHYDCDDGSLEKQSENKHSQSIHSEEKERVRQSRRKHTHHQHRHHRQHDVATTSSRADVETKPNHSQRPRRRTHESSTGDANSQLPRHHHRHTQQHDIAAPRQEKRDTREAYRHGATRTQLDIAIQSNPVDMNTIADEDAGIELMFIPQKHRKSHQGSIDRKHSGNEGASSRGSFELTMAAIPEDGSYKSVFDGSKKSNTQHSDGAKTQTRRLNEVCALNQEYIAWRVSATPTKQFSSSVLRKEQILAAHNAVKTNRNRTSYWVGKAVALVKRFVPRKDPACGLEEIIFGNDAPNTQLNSETSTDVPLMCETPSSETNTKDSRDSKERQVKSKAAKIAQIVRSKVQSTLLLCSRSKSLEQQESELWSIFQDATNKGFVKVTRPPDNLDENVIMLGPVSGEDGYRFHR